MLFKTIYRSVLLGLAGAGVSLASDDYMGMTAGDQPAIKSYSGRANTEPVNDLNPSEPTDAYKELQVKKTALKSDYRARMEALRLLNTAK